MTAERTTRDRGRPPVPLRRAAAGVLASAGSLAAGRFGAQLLPGTADPVAAVGRQVIDLAPAGLREAAVGAVGTADKPLLLLGTALLALFAGAGVGLVHAHSRALARVLIAALWAVGAAAVLAVPGTTPAPAGLQAGGAALIGVLVLDVLLPPTRSDAAGQEHTGQLDRRAFLARSAGVLILATAVAGGASALARRAGSRVHALLPVPRRRAPRPPADPRPVPGRTPLVTSNAALYRVDTALQTPRVDTASWRLAVTGLVGERLSWSYQDLLRMPQVEAWITLGCVGNEVGGDLVGTPLWQGVLLSALLRQAGPLPAASQLVGRSVDGYTGAFPLPLALDGRDALVALGMNGEPLPADHGFPARLVVPGLYGYESAVKWLAEVELADDTYRAYWVRRGYARYAAFRTQSRIDVPVGGATVAAGTVVVAGMAWAPHRGVRAVEVRADDGPWVPARLEGDVLGNDAWRPWATRLPLAAGAHVLAVRATDGLGDVQPALVRDVLPDGATGHHSVRVRVV